MKVPWGRCLRVGQSLQSHSDWLTQHIFRYSRYAHDKTTDDNLGPLALMVATGRLHGRVTTFTFLYFGFLEVSHEMKPSVEGVPSILRIPTYYLAFKKMMHSSIS